MRRFATILALLYIGDTIDMKGPKGHLEYVGNGIFTVQPLRKSEPMQTRSARLCSMADSQ